MLLRSKRAGDCAIPLLRGVQGGVLPLREHTPATTPSLRAPSQEGILIDMLLSCICCKPQMLGRPKYYKVD